MSLYDEGDDEMKRTIAKAWTQNKSGNALDEDRMAMPEMPPMPTGLGGMGGLPDFDDSGGMPDISKLTDMMGNLGDKL